MEVTSQSKNDKIVEIPDDTEMILAEDNKRIRAFRNANTIKINDEIYFEGDLWQIIIKEQNK